MSTGGEPVLKEGGRVRGRAQIEETLFSLAIAMRGLRYFVLCAAWPPTTTGELEETSSEVVRRVQFYIYRTSNRNYSL